MVLTWESFRPNFSANFFLSGLLMYFCIWKRFSRPWRWASENTARRIMPRLGLPLVVHGKPAANVRPASGRNRDDWLAADARPFGVWFDVNVLALEFVTIFNMGPVCPCCCCGCTFDAAPTDPLFEPIGQNYIKKNEF